MTGATGRAGILRFDGGSRGNPGPAASGFVIEVDGQVVLEEGHFLGRATNNEAEYAGLIRGMKRARDLHIDKLVICGDSQLVILQMMGRYKVRARNLKEPFRKARELTGEFAAVEFKFVPREKNEEADKILNKALNEKHDVME